MDLVLAVESAHTTLLKRKILTEAAKDNTVLLLKSKNYRHAAQWAKVGEGVNPSHVNPRVVNPECGVIALLLSANIKGSCRPIQPPRTIKASEKNTDFLELQERCSAELATPGTLSRRGKTRDKAGK